MRATPRVTLLLLSGGGHTGCNVMASLASRRASMRLLATSDVADEPALFAFDGAYLAPRLADDAAGFERRVLEIIDRESPDLVIPCRDADVYWLSTLRERRPDLAPRLLCGASAIAAMVNDKWLSHEFCVRHALPFAASLPLTAEADLAGFVARAGLPLVAKPRHGVDSKGIFLLTGIEQLERARALDDYVLQAYLGDAQQIRDYVAAIASHGVPLFHSFLGDKRSIQIMIAPDGRVDYALCTRNRMTGRISRSIMVDDDAEAEAIGRECAHLFAREGWRGPLNVQCQPDANGQLRIHEFNARFTGATSARWQLGFDEVGAALRLFANVELAAPDSNARRPRFALESLAARAASADFMDQLETHGQWQRWGA
jgi:biotin carboxylase